MTPTRMQLQPALSSRNATFGSRRTSRICALYCAIVGVGGVTTGCTTQLAIIRQRIGVAQKPAILAAQRIDMSALLEMSVAGLTRAAARPTTERDDSGLIETRLFTIGHGGRCGKVRPLPELRTKNPLHELNKFRPWCAQDPTSRSEAALYIFRPVDTASVTTADEHHVNATLRTHESTPSLDEVSPLAKTRPFRGPRPVCKQAPAKTGTRLFS